MKYWRGYLVAAVLAVCTLALRGFARANTLLVDMAYPYMSRMLQSHLAGRSSEVDFCLWQVLLVAIIALILIGGVLMIVFRKNPVRYLGWICTGVAALVFLHTALYGLNAFSGPISADVRLISTDYTLTELENATIYYREQANDLSSLVTRDDAGNVVFDSFEALAVQAADGFRTLTYDQSLSVFAGSVAPVKKLSGGRLFSNFGVSGVTVGLTGEAAVNPYAPAVMIPFEMCRQMAKRMCIVKPEDAGFAAYLACKSNQSVEFQYSGVLMSYRYCLQALENLAQGTYDRVRAGETGAVTYDVSLCDGFGIKENVCDLLVSWHIDKVVLPAQQVEQEKFDPLDKDQVGNLT